MPKPGRRGTASKGKAAPLAAAGQTIEPGTAARLEFPVARLATGTWLTLPVIVLHGARPGPALWLSGAIHGDELNGIEIIRRVVKRLRPERMAGTVWAVPVVNVFGFIDEQRYLPDRRDLNRNFPGSSGGSLAAQVAHLFMREIASRCTHGLDLHTGSDHRTNLPHVRGDLDHPETLRIATAFGTRFIVHAQTRDGSLRQAAAKRGIPCLVFEAGEPNRFNDVAIAEGTLGVLRVAHALGMAPRPSKAGWKPVRIDRTRWVRARRSGLLRLRARPGDEIAKGEQLGVIGDAFGEHEAHVHAPDDGIVIGMTLNPIVHKGDGIVHLALRD